MSYFFCKLINYISRLTSNQKPRTPYSSHKTKCPICSPKQTAYFPIDLIARPFEQWIIIQYYKQEGFRKWSSSWNWEGKASYAQLPRVNREAFFVIYQFFSPSRWQRQFKTPWLPFGIKMRGATVWIWVEVKEMRGQPAAHIPTMCCKSISSNSGNVDKVIENKQAILITL